MFAAIYHALTVCLRAFRALPKAIAIATVLTTLSGMFWALFSLGAFASLGMPFFETVGLPMQISVIVMVIFLMGRTLKNRPESAINSVPLIVRVLVPVAVVASAWQLSQIPSSMPSKSPAGGPVHHFEANVENGACTALFNDTERVIEPLYYCANYQRRFNSTFAAAWLLFSSLELWGAWAIYGGEPVRRIQPDRKHLVQVVSDDRETTEYESAVRSTKPYVWLSLRLVILAYFAIGGWNGFKDTVSIPGFLILFTLLWGAVATRYWIVQAYTSTKRTEPWLLPSRFSNPFQRSQPFRSCPGAWCTSRDFWFGWTRAQRTTADSRAG